MSPYTPTDGERQMYVEPPRTVKPFTPKLRLFRRGGLARWRLQRAHTQKHLLNEHERGFRLVHLGNGHFMGFRPWCDTKLYHCPDLPGVMCCMCQHGESQEAATR